jgi:hypothetical protein
MYTDSKGQQIVPNAAMPEPKSDAPPTPVPSLHRITHVATPGNPTVAEQRAATGSIMCGACDFKVLRFPREKAERLYEDHLCAEDVADLGDVECDRWHCEDGAHDSRITAWQVFWRLVIVWLIVADIYVTWKAGK